MRPEAGITSNKRRISGSGFIIFRELGIGNWELGIGDSIHIKNNNIYLWVVEAGKTRPNEFSEDIKGFSWIRKREI